MKTFLKNVPGQIARIYMVMLVCFTVISLAGGVETIPTVRLAQLLLLSVIGGFLMEAAFGKCILRRTAYVKRVCIFTAPFAGATLLCAAVFRWDINLGEVRTYIKFAGIFIACGIVSVILFEIEHWIRGREYTWKLKEYQNREDKDE